MACTVVFDQAFLQALCDTGRDVPLAPAAPVLDPRKLGQAALLAWLRRNDAEIQSQQTKRILHQLRTFPRDQQARLLEKSGICARWKAQD